MASEVMTDRLDEIKAAVERTKIEPYHYDADGLDQVRALQDLNWAIVEIERLRAPDPQYPCESCGKMTVSVVGEEIVCFKCYEASVTRRAFLDAAKMAERKARVKYDETTKQACAGNTNAANQLYSEDQALRQFAADLRRAAEEVKDGR